MIGHHAPSVQVVAAAVEMQQGALYQGANIRSGQNTFAMAGIETGLISLPSVDGCLARRPRLKHSARKGVGQPEIDRLRDCAGLPTGQTPPRMPFG